MRLIGDNPRSHCADRKGQSNTWAHFVLVGRPDTLFLSGDGGGCDGCINSASNLAAKLAKIIENTKGHPRVSVGFLRDATYPDGTSVAMVARRSGVR